MDQEMFGADPPYRLRRNKDQGSYSKQDVYEVLDSTAICHLAVVEQGMPVVVPTLFARRGDEVLVHGSRASSILRAAREDVMVNLTATLLDALVLPDNIFDHTVDYRTASVAGHAKVIEDETEKSNALRYLSDRVLPQRYGAVREPDEKELRQTSIISIAIEQAVVKSSFTDLESLDSVAVWTGKLALGPRSVRAMPSEHWRHSTDGIDPQATAALFLP